MSENTTHEDDIDVGFISTFGKPQQFAASTQKDGFIPGPPPEDDDEPE